MALTLGEIADTLNCELKGDSHCEISAVATLQNAGANQISFLANNRYRRFLASTGASAVILRKEDVEHCPTNALISKNPYLIYAHVATLLNPVGNGLGGIHPSAVIEEGCNIDPTAYIGANCYIASGVTIGAGSMIGPGCVIEEGVSVGANSRLVANVTLCHDVVIGDNALFHAGVVIGSDGFGFANDAGSWVKVPQLGRVVIGNDVEIGANTTVDRGALEDTVIEDDVKLDNQIQVAHNVHIGAHTAIAGCTGIAGSATIGKRCQIGGGVVVLGHLEIVDDVHITAMSFVAGNIAEPGVYSSGTLLEQNRTWHKNAVRIKQLDDMARRLKALEKKLEE